jgi:hypothetical protein
VQIELERERSKKDDGAVEWIEKSRTLGKELDWSREEALRLDRSNQQLASESARLKAQVGSVCVCVCVCVCRGKEARGVAA